MSGFISTFGVGSVSDITAVLTYAYLIIPLSVSAFTWYHPVFFVSTLYVISFPSFVSATTFPLYVSSVLFIFPSVTLTFTVIFGSSYFAVMFGYITFVPISVSPVPPVPLPEPEPVPICSTFIIPYVPL